LSDDDDGAADTATLSRAEPVLTETMAELYLKQGHQQDALRVYQALLGQRPNDAKLKSKVEQLSPGGKKKSGVSAQAFLKGIWSGRGSQSTLASAFDAAGPPPGEPSRPADDHISLDSVFGEEPGRRPAQSIQSPQGSAAPAGGTDPRREASRSMSSLPAGSRGRAGPAGRAGRAGGRGGGAGEGAAEAASPKTLGGNRSSGRTQRPPEDEVEADQFQQWLKKLKS